MKTDSYHRQSSRPVAAALTLGVLMVAVIADSKAQAETPEEQLKALQMQVSILQQQLQLSTLQQTEQAKLAQGVADALKSQVTSESELTKLQAQAEFAKLAGIKAGLDSVGPPPGKEGKLTITTGTAGALMLNLKRPMLEGLHAAAKHVADTAAAHEPALSGGLVLATDTEIQAALQSEVTKAALSDAIMKADDSINAVQGAGLKTASLLTTVAAAGLALKTVTDFSKFFRADRSMTLFDAGEEPNQILRLLLESQLGAKEIAFVKLDDINPDRIVALAKEAQSSLAVLAVRHDAASALLTQIDKIPLADPARPSVGQVDKLKESVTLAKELLDGLHPVRKPEAFWAYVSGQYKHERLKSNGTYRARISTTAKAQTIQVIETRVFRSDKIYGSADAQVEYRIVDKDGVLVASGVWLWNSKDAGSPLVLSGPKSLVTSAPAATPTAPQTSTSATEPRT